MLDHKQLRDSDDNQAAKTFSTRHLSPKAVSMIQGNPDSHAGQPSDHKLSDAQAAAREAIKDIDLPNRIMATRLSSEAAALVTVGAGAHHLDQLCRDNPNLGIQGNNYPGYDLLSPTEITSVKTHWREDGTLTPSKIDDYIRDFNRILGDHSPNLLARDAKNLINVCSNTAAEYPSELKLHSPDQVQKYLRDKSVLRVPDDHVGPVQEKLAKKMEDFPRNYYLPESISKDAIWEIVKARVKGIGVDSTYLQKLIGL